MSEKCSCVTTWRGGGVELPPLLIPHTVQWAGRRCRILSTTKLRPMDLPRVSDGQAVRRMIESVGSTLKPACSKEVWRGGAGRVDAADG
jgi:hypothetical protein